MMQCGSLSNFTSFEKTDNHVKSKIPTVDLYGDHTAPWYLIRFEMFMHQKITGFD